LSSGSPSRFIAAVVALAWEIWIIHLGPQVDEAWRMLAATVKVASKRCIEAGY
jgi:hypothetical protein